MKRIKLITGLALPVMAIGGVAAPLLLTTSCASEHEGTYYNDGATLKSSSLGKMTCTHKDDYKDKAFHVGQVYTFHLIPVNDVENITIWNQDASKGNDNGYRITWIEPASQPADWATNGIGFDHTSTQMTISFQQKCYIGIYVDGGAGGNVGYKKVGHDQARTGFDTMIMRAVD